MPTRWLYLSGNIRKTQSLDDNKVKKQKESPRKLKGRVRRGETERERDVRGETGRGGNKIHKEGQSRRGKETVFPLVCWYNRIIRSLMTIRHITANRLKRALFHIMYSNVSEQK